MSIYCGRYPLARWFWRPGGCTRGESCHWISWSFFPLRSLSFPLVKPTFRESTGKGAVIFLNAWFFTILLGPLLQIQGQHCHLCPPGALQKRKRQQRQLVKALRKSTVATPWSLGTENEGPSNFVFKGHVATPLHSLLIVQLERRWSLLHDFVRQNTMFHVVARKRIHVSWWYFFWWRCSTARSRLGSDTYRSSSMDSGRTTNLRGRIVRHLVPFICWTELLRT